MKKESQRRGEVRNRAGVPEKQGTSQKKREGTGSWRGDRLRFIRGSGSHSPEWLIVTMTARGRGVNWGGNSSGRQIPTQKGSISPEANAEEEGAS